MTDVSVSKANISKALNAWGEELPDWIRALALEADRSSPKEAGRRCGISKTSVSELVHRKYGAETGAMEQRVRGGLMRGPVRCPVVGTISGDVCLANQSAPYRPVNPTMVELYRRCRTCDHRIGSRDHDK